MEALYLLIPISLALVALVIGAFVWAVHAGQFEDLEGPAYRILMDDDGAQADPQSVQTHDEQPDAPHANKARS